MVSSPCHGTHPYIAMGTPQLKNCTGLGPRPPFGLRLYPTSGIPTASATLAQHIRGSLGACRSAGDYFTETMSGGLSNRRDSTCQRTREPLTERRWPAARALAQECRRAAESPHAWRYCRVEAFVSAASFRSSLAYSERRHLVLFDNCEEARGALGERELLYGE
jgi:hypothetical protein